MINYNGNILAQSGLGVEDNRAFLYGDSIFETIKVLDDKILFAEEHYFRLMASLRIVRMEIPMFFTQEYMEEQIIGLLGVLPHADSFRVRITFFRKPGGYYLPTDNDAEFIISAVPMENSVYNFSGAPYEVDLYRDFYITRQLLSTIKTANKMVNITGSIFARENGLDNCLLLNDEKNVIEALQGNLFMLMGTSLITPPVADGCLNGIMRRQVMEIARRTEGLTVEEKSVSPFDLQKADELFITNVIVGIRPITKYRKKVYSTAVAENLLKKLNAKIRLG